MIRQRLFLQIYLTVIAALALTVITTSLVFSRLGPEERPSATAIALAQRAVLEALPAADAPLAEQIAVLERIGSGLGIELALFDANGDLIVAYPSSDPENWTGRRSATGDFPENELRVSDGRVVAASLPFPGNGFVGPLLITLASIATAIGVASYPFVRRLSGRLERLQSAVERVGEGKLGTRARVEGSDEIAALASSFNASADRIEALVNAHRVLLANASHELRTPLSRIRLGIEMFQESGDRSRLSGIAADITQLERLIDEILTLSRLEAGAIDMEPGIDFLGLVAEECAHFGVAVEGLPAEIRGNRQLLQRLVRNLVVNAQRHGAPPVEVEVQSSGRTTKLIVRDGGDGIPRKDRERVFERFFRGADKQDVEGYGLCLPLVRQIALAHGASVEIAHTEVNELIVVFGDEVKGDTAPIRP